MCFNAPNRHVTQKYVLLLKIYYFVTPDQTAVDSLECIFVGNKLSYLLLMTSTDVLTVSTCCTMVSCMLCFAYLEIKFTRARSAEE